MASTKLAPVDTNHSAFKEAVDNVNGQTKKLLGASAKRTVTSFHRDLGKLMWEYCGMARNASGLKQAIGKIDALGEEYWATVNVPGSGEELNQSLETAGRVADLIELGSLMCRDALAREESCGGHYREEHQTPEGEALRDDDNYSYVAAWQWEGDKKAQTLVKEPLTFDYVHPSQRSYK